MRPEIAFSGLMLDYAHSGSATYARELLTRLPSAATDLTIRLFTRRTDPEVVDMQKERLASPVEGWNGGTGVGARADKLAWEWLMLPLASARHRDAVIHVPYFAPPIAAASPVVVTIHDVIPLVLPGYHRSRQSSLYSRLMAWTSRKAARVITVSQHSKQDIVRILRVPEDRVIVTYEAASDAFRPDADRTDTQGLRDRYRLPEQFVLYLGGAERRKNIETLVRAWDRVAPDMRRLEVKLVLVARFPPPDTLYPDIPRIVRALGLSEDVYLIPEVAEEYKPALYRSALALAFPSVYEGFGFSPLEAMACGTPVVASRATSIPEVVGSGGVLLDPTSVDAWAEALLDLARSPATRDELAEKGLKNAARFSWDRTARETADVYRALLS